LRIWGYKPTLYRVLQWLAGCPSIENLELVHKYQRYANEQRNNERYSMDELSAISRAFCGLRSVEISALPVPFTSQAPEALRRFFNGFANGLCGFSLDQTLPFRLAGQEDAAAVVNALARSKSGPTLQMLRLGRTQANTLELDENALLPRLQCVFSSSEAFVNDVDRARRRRLAPNME
jgi:hypothetical protein